jgi:hypothetical protein
MHHYCRLLRFSRIRQAYLPRTRDIRDTYGTIAPRNSPLFVPQKFPIIKIRVRQMDRKSQTALLRRKRQSMIKLLCNKCNGCASSSSHRFQICGSPKKNATIASEVLCVACNTRSAIRSTSSPAQIEICGVPIPPCQIVAVNQPLSRYYQIWHNYIQYFFHCSACSIVMP